MTTIDIAKICHEANRAYCQTLGDYSQQAWEEAPQWQRASSIRGVHFLLNNPDATPRDSHIEWLKEKKETGWKYGPTKDPEKKEHPCCIPYDELPMALKTKDTLFDGIVNALRTCHNIDTSTGWSLQSI